MPHVQEVIGFSPFTVFSKTTKEESTERGAHSTGGMSTAAHYVILRWPCVVDGTLKYKIKKLTSKHQG